MTKKSVAVYISGTIYHMIVIYGTLCKLMISLGVSFIFSKFWFCGLLRGSKYKKWPKMTKNFVLCTLYLRNYTSFLDLWCTYLHVFFTIFPNFNFQGQQLVKRAKNGLKWQKVMSIALHIWVSIHHFIMFFVAQV